ncbi:hypothetical protein At1g04090-like [Rutidosis leptorrhynchoides]|uniref:hypothetical protein At1g04090-like n=1 Tax=Rutidosis leptorrhynchoides TaxID=125765 RepID=UPI003A990237
MNSSLIVTLILFSLFFSFNVATMINSQDNIHNIIQLPSSLPRWTLDQGEGFGSGTIDLGGLAVTHVTSFKKIWSINIKGGPDTSGITFYDPVEIPHGFSSLGSYAHPNNIPLFAHFHVAKDVSNNPYKPALKSPIDYVLRWSSRSLNISKDGEVYVWLPIAPYRYKAIGYVITSEFKKPSLDRVSCVHVKFTDHTTTKRSSNYHVDFTDHTRTKTSLNDHVMTIAFENPNVIDLNRLHVHSSMGGIKIKNERLGKLQGTNKVSYALPNLGQIRTLIKAYAPVIYFHPDEEYLPSSVEWFFENGALLYHVGDELKPIPVQSNGANLPQGGPNDDTYWLDLPVDWPSKERVMSGNLQTARAYFHVKPVSGGLYTDISIWVFHPFNGASRAKVLSKVILLGRIGEHVGDWEHVTLRISNINGELNSVYFGRHSWGEWVSGADLEWDANSRVIAYSALHGHGLYPRSGMVHFGWKGAKVAGLVDITAPSNKVMDTGVGAMVVAAEYLGGVVVEPPWLNYMRNWGPPIKYVIDEELDAILHSLKWYLRGVFRRFIESMPKVLFGADGPSGPKVKNSWNGSEELYMEDQRILYYIF